MRDKAIPRNKHFKFQLIQLLIESTQVVLSFIIITLTKFSVSNINLHGRNKKKSNKKWPSD